MSLMYQVYSAPTPTLVFTELNKVDWFALSGVVRISRNGSIEFEAGYEPDEAAKAFWKHVSEAAGWAGRDLLTADGSIQSQEDMDVGFATIKS